MALRRLGMDSYLGNTALGLTALAGALDEGLQILIPTRVFDPVDMLFNSIAAFMAIGGGVVLQIVRKRFRKDN